MTLQSNSIENSTTHIVIIRVALYICAILLFTWFIISLILPTLTFSHNVRNTDPVFDLSEPQITLRKINSTTFSASTERSGDTIQLNVTAKKEGKSNFENHTVSIYKAHQTWQEAALASPPQGTQLKNSKLSEQQIKKENASPFRSGTIVRSESEYFIVDEQALRPIDRPETLLASGYSFDNVEVSTSAQRSFYTKGKIFTIRDTHPNGTIFSLPEGQDNNSQRYYEKKDKSLIEKSPAEISQKKTPTQIIEVQEHERTHTQSCILKKKIFTRNKTYSCSIDVQGIARHTGKDYIFIIDDVQPTEIDTITVQIAQSPTRENIQRQLGLIISKSASNNRLQ